MRVRAIGSLAFVMSLAQSASARVLDQSFTESHFVSTVNDADLTSMAWAPDGSNRLFLTGKEGVVHVIENGVRRPEPFAVVSPLYFGSECGLLSIAFDPDYGTNRYVYVFATVSSSEQRIIRYRDDDGVGTDPTTIVAGLPTLGLNHDGGALGFGPDGKLYWAIGDLGNGTGANADLTSLAAKVGRANRDGSTPGDNPFDDGPGPNHDLIWARGFRNPFTMTFQPSTGALWLNVVGTSLEQVFSVGAGDHGGWGVYEALQPSGFIRSRISYRTNGSDTHAVAASAATRAAGVVTVELSTAHLIQVGAQVTLSGMDDASFDGQAFVSGLPSPTSIEFRQAGPDATAGGGSVTTAALGGCITGGVFYDSTSADEEYRGNYFFGDFNTGNLMRARVEGDNVTSVEIWGDGHAGVVDMTVGDDGDLYYVSHHGDGIVYRARFAALSQRLVVSRSHVGMLEGGVAAFSVRLAQAPSDTVEVSVARVSGDPDVAITEGAQLSFGVDDWSTPKVIRVAARPDFDLSDDSAGLEVSAEALDSANVTVRVVDEGRAGEPPGEGGAGGEHPGGAGGEDARGGTGGGAGTPSTGGDGGGAGAPGDSGAPGDAGQGGDDRGGEGGAGDRSPGGGTGGGGCGCATSHGGENAFGAFVVATCLLFRRRRAWQAKARHRH